MTPERAHSRHAFLLAEYAVRAIERQHDMESCSEQLVLVRAEVAARCACRLVRNARRAQIQSVLERTAKLAEADPHATPAIDALREAVAARNAAIRSLIRNMGKLRTADGPPPAVATGMTRRLPPAPSSLAAVEADPLYW